MSSRSTWVWLTALTTVSLAVSGCQEAGAGRPTAAGAVAPAAPAGTPQPVAFVGPRAIAGADRMPPPAGPQVLVVSDGSEVVDVGGHPVRFPGPVTDAVASPNGTSLAYVDGQGDIAVARLDGSGTRVLTSTDPAVLRAQPTFEDDGAEIVFSERGHDGVWRLKEVATDGHDHLTGGTPDPTVAETVADRGGDTAPSAIWAKTAPADGARSVLVYEHRTSRGLTKVYIADRNQRSFGANPLLPGRSPALSPDGTRVAFIGEAGRLCVVSLYSAKRRPTVLSRAAAPVGHLVWSPDGRRIVFSTSHDVESVSSTAHDPGGDRPRVVHDRPGVATFARETRPTVGTFDATDPVATAVAVSRARYAGGMQLPDAQAGLIGAVLTDHVVLLSTTDRAAAVPAAVIADGGPILFLDGGTLAPQVADEIVRLLRSPRGAHRPVTVDIVGDTDAVPDSVAAGLHELGVHLRVRRFVPDGPDAAPAAAASAVRGPWSSYAVVSQGDLPAVVGAASSPTRVLLTEGATMPPKTARHLDRMPRHLSVPATVFAVGRPAQRAVRSSWPGRRPFRIVDVGGHRPSDSLAVVRALYDGPTRATVTSGGDWRRQLIAGMAGPSVVVPRQAGPALLSWLAASGAALGGVYAVGGTATLAARLAHAAYAGHDVLREDPARLAP